MRRGLVLALLLLVSTPAAAGSPFDEVAPSTDASDSIQIGEPQIGLLILESERKSRFSTSSVDVSTSVAIQRDETETRLHRYAFDARLERADSMDDRQAILRSAVDHARFQYLDIRDRETDLRAAYRNGSIDASTYARELARNDARAGALQEYTTAIATRTDSSDTRLDTRLEKVDNRLIEFQGPVRDRMLSAVQGDRAPIRLYISASPEGTVLAMVTDEQYVREAYRDDKQTDASTRLELDRVVSLAETIYPDAINESQSWDISYLSGAGVYRLNFRAPSTTLTAYLHGETRQVYHDVRVVQLTGDEATPGPTVTELGTRVVINRSYRGGPLRIATYDNATGDPIDAPVIVEDTRLQTGPDGVVWTLTPDTVQFSVTVVRPRGNVSTLVRTIEPVQLNDST